MNDVFLLRQLMSELSERCYCAGWLIGTEFTLWSMILNDCKKSEWGHGTVESWELHRLKELSKMTGGWWIFTSDTDSYFGHAFISLEDWKELYEKEVKNGIL